MAVARVMESVAAKPAEGWDSDGSLSWEDFFGSNATEDLVPTLVSMYDALIGRPSAAKEEPAGPEVTVRNPKDARKPAPLPDRGKNLANWSNKIERSLNCRCTGKSASEAITRCASCVTHEPEIRSTDIRDSKVFVGDVFSDTVAQDGSVQSEKCELVTCPAGLPSTPGTPLPLRLLLPPSRSPLALKRLRAGACVPRPEEFLCVPRPLSVSSIASSSSSSSSGTSSCSGVRRLGVPHKSSAYLASIESLEDDSDNESLLQKGGSCRADRFKSGGSQGSEDSGVHSPCSYISSPSPPQSKPRYCGPHLSYMDRVVMEIVETEGVYVEDLHNIIQGYLVVWRSLPDFPLADRLDHLFSNIEDIYHFNSLFLRELQQCGLHPGKVAQCFVRNNVGFSIYTEYCTNYPRTVSSLTELMRQEGTARMFRERQSALQHALPLGSYLLKPVQRILKYHLLLQNLLKQYGSDTEGYQIIVDALSTMTGIAQHINDMKRRHEHAVRVQEIQSLLYGWEGEDLTTFGELCAEGTFRMCGAKALRHVFLFDKMLLITKKKEEGILGYKAHINCSNLMLIESVPGEPLSFHVIPFDNPRLQYTLQGRNLEQKREWTLQLKRVILENYNAVIPSHARQLVMELGQNRTEDEIMADKSVSKRQHSAPEYLEKRKQDRRKSEAGLKSRLRRVRKSDAGNATESQQRLARTHNLGSPNLGLDKLSEDVNKNHMLGTWRRKSEPGIYSREKDSETEDAAEERLAEDAKTTNSTPEKESSDGEGTTLEQIVGQLIMQNRGLEKMMKKQQKRVMRRTGEDHKTDSTDDDDDGAYETLKVQGASLASETDGSVCYDTENSEEPDYVTLVYQPCPRNDDRPVLKKQNSLKECARIICSVVRRTQSFHITEEPELKVAAALSQASLEGASLPSLPTLPSVWLRQQGQHLATPSNKAGSLPRSFQLAAESAPNDPRSFRDFRNSIERPFTIASDKPPYDDMERYGMTEKAQFCRRMDGPEDDSLTEGLSTPGASTDHINVHPEYKIYRTSVTATVLKNMLSSVGSKLASMKQEGSCRSEQEVRTALQREHKAARAVCLLARQCNRTVRQRLRTALEPSPRPTLPVYKQGSSGLGARIAHTADHATETPRVSRVKPSKKAAALLGVRPGSVLSLASTITTTSSDGDKMSTTDLSAITQDKDATCDVDSDGSTDSIYERTFEAIEDEIETGTDTDDCEPKTSPAGRPQRTPPPVPAKPKRLMPCEEGAAGERQTKREEEGDTSSQHSTASTVIDTLRDCSLGGGTMRPRGWVRHIVGKLQGGL